MKLLRSFTTKPEEDVITSQASNPSSLKSKPDSPHFPSHPHKKKIVAHKPTLHKVSKKKGKKGNKKKKEKEKMYLTLRI